MKFLSFLIGFVVFLGSDAHSMNPSALNQATGQSLPVFACYRDPKYLDRVATLVAQTVPPLQSALIKNNQELFEAISKTFFTENLPCGYDQDVIFPVLEAAISRPNDTAIKMLLQHEQWSNTIYWLGDSMEGLLCQMAKNGHTKNVKSILQHCLTQISSDKISAIEEALKE